MTEKTREEAPGKTLEAVLEDPVGNRPEVADEIQALQAIFGDSNVQVRDISQPISSKSTWAFLLPYYAKFLDLHPLMIPSVVLPFDQDTTRLEHYFTMP
jgi:hypothetical protein